MHSVDLAVRAKALLGKDGWSSSFSVPGSRLVSTLLGPGLAPRFHRFRSVWSTWGRPTVPVPGAVVITESCVGILVGENYSGDRIAYVTERGGRCVMLNAGVAECAFRLHPSMMASGKRLICAD